MNAVALTDHGNMFGAINFFKACKKAGIKPIVGCELYVTPRSRFERGEAGDRKSANHLLTFATDFDGYLSLCKLSSIGYTEGYYRKPRVDHETLAKYHKGVIATTACLKGEIPEALIEGDEKRARSLIDTYMEIFGPENFYFELQDHGLTEQKQLIPIIRRLSQHYHRPIIATNDCHYVRKEDSGFHDVLLCIQTGKTLEDQKRFRFQGDEFYLKTPEEMYALFSEMREACRETVALAERCNSEIKLDQKLLPVYRPPDGMSIEDYLRKLTFDGLTRRYGTPTQQQIDRANTELQCIKNMGFSSYFLIVWDFIHYSKVNGIPVGPGRGSAAGSVVAYCLGITDIDPLEHGLIFERFLNPERISMPDIDIDFCFENRWRVIEYVKKKYGEKNVAQIITFGTLKPKNAIRDVGRAMSVPLAEVDKVAKLIPAMLKPDKGKTGIDTALANTPELKDLYESDPQKRQIIDYARQLEGMARHASTHAAGVVISDQDISDIVPVYKPADSNDIATQFTMTLVEEVGLLKMDFLGLKNLTIIENTLRSIRKNYGVEIDWSKISLNEPKTYELLRAGKTFGVFQLESSGMTSLVKRLGPTSFEDLTALLALYRPGPLGSGMVDDYVERKHGRKELRYDHPLLESILRETYGVILYQEQVMKIAQVLAGFTLGEADLMRRAMGKKKAEEMAKQRLRFREGCARSEIPEKLADHIFDQIDYFAGYGFNKSHSAAYAVVSFRTAYLKAYYPVDYLAALMTNAIGGKVEEMAAFFAEAKDSSIRILPPDINESEKQFTVSGGNIRFGLAAVKNVGENAVDAIMATREHGGPFRSFEDFCSRMDSSLMNSRMIDCLIKVGAYDSLGVRRSQLLSCYQRVLDIAAAVQKERESGQASLFDVFDEQEESSGQAPQSFAGAVSMPDLPEIPDREKLQYEKDLIGYYVSGHPLDAYMYDIAAFSSTKLARVSTLNDGREVTLVGMVSNVLQKQDKNGGTMGFVEITDLQASVEIIFFRDVFEKCRALLANDEVVVVTGRVSSRNGENKILAREAKAIEDVRERMTESIEISMGMESVRNGAMEELSRVLKSSPGRRPVKLLFVYADRGELSVELPKGSRVHLSNEFVRALQTLPGLKGVKFISRE